MAVPSSGSLEAFWGRLKHSPVLNTQRRMFHKPANMSDTKTDMDGEGIPNKPASGKLFSFFFSLPRLLAPGTSLPAFI